MTSRKKSTSSERFLPLSPSRFEVLVSLAEGDKHGYAILKDVERRSGGAVRLRVSTLYSVLDRLEEAGLIEESDQRPDPALDDERRRYYRLTALGARVARAEASRLENVLDAARALNLLGPVKR